MVYSCAQIMHSTSSSLLFMPVSVSMCLYDDGVWCIYLQEVSIWAQCCTSLRGNTWPSHNAVCIWLTVFLSTKSLLTFIFFHQHCPRLEVSFLSGQTQQSSNWRNSYYRASELCPLPIHWYALSQPLVTLPGCQLQSTSSNTFLCLAKPCSILLSVKFQTSALSLSQ